MRNLKTTHPTALASPNTLDSKHLAGITAFLAEVIAAQTLRLPLLLPIGLAIGAAIYLNLHSEPRWPAIISGLATSSGIALLANKIGNQIIFWIAAFLFATTLGAAVAKVRTETVAAPVLVNQIGPSRIEGRLIEIDSNDRNLRLRLQVNAIEGLTREQTPKFVRFSYRYPIDFGPGRSISCTAILSPPPAPTVAGDYAFHRDAWFDQLGAVGFAVSPCAPVFAPPPATLLDWSQFRIAAIRRYVANHVLAVAGTTGGPMAAAMIAGDRSYIQPEDVEALRGSGLAHLLAISGLHMALAGGAFFVGLRVVWPFAGPVALKVPAIKVAAAGAIIGCTAYFVLSGGGIATERAYIMALIAFSAKLIDKPALSLRSLAIAFAAIVLLHPEAVVTPGFQMSFAATAALIGTFSIWKPGSPSATSGALIRLGSWGFGAIATSITASLATTPFAIYHFDRAAPLGILANVVVTPIISFWAAPSAATALVVSMGGLQDPFLMSLGAALEQVIAIAHLANDRSPEIQLPPINGWVIVLMTAAIAAYSMLAGWGRLLCVPPIIIGAVIWAQAERPVGYIATNGAIFFQDSETWLKISDWQRSDALTPLALGTRPSALKCPERSTECSLTSPSGALQISLSQEPEPGATQSHSYRHGALCSEMPGTISIQGSGPTSPLKIEPCAIAPGYSAAIYAGKSSYRLKMQTMNFERPWTPKPSSQ